MTPVTNNTAALSNKSALVINTPMCCEDCVLSVRRVCLVLNTDVTPCIAARHKNCPLHILTRGLREIDNE